MDAVAMHPWTDGPPPVALMGAWPIHALMAPCMIDPWMGIISVWMGSVRCMVGALVWQYPWTAPSMTEWSGPVRVTLTWMGASTPCMAPTHWYGWVEGASMHGHPRQGSGKPSILMGGPINTAGINGYAIYRRDYHLVLALLLGAARSATGSASALTKWQDFNYYY